VAALGRSAVGSGYNRASPKDGKAHDGGLLAAICRSAERECQKFARSSLDAKRLHAMLSLAQPELSILPADLDVSNSLLNFQNGTVDLRGAS
jgi:hypothetical protein